MNICKQIHMGTRNPKLYTLQNVLIKDLKAIQRVFCILLRIVIDTDW